MFELRRDPTREGLRHLVNARVLAGWYTHKTSDGTIRWVVIPREGVSSTYDSQQVREYLRMAGALPA
jgi:hypothetical protein